MSRERMYLPDDVERLPCGHSWSEQNPRPHVGDTLCHRCRRQSHVWDWDLYNSLDRIPEPGKRGSLQPAPQWANNGGYPIHLDPNVRGRR